MEGPAVSKPNGRRLKLTELRAQGTESLGMEPGYEIELDDGSTIVIPNPLLVDDTTQDALQGADGVIATAKAILGETEHARFLAGGGHSNDVMLAWNLMRKEAEEAGPKLPR